MKTGTLNPDSFEKLYSSYGARALRLASAILRDKDLAADAVQEAFIRVFKNKDRYNTELDFEPWFRRILINECRRIYVKRRPYVELDSLPEAAEPAGSDENELLRREIDRLEPKYRELILLKYMIGCTEVEIASITGLPKSTVKSRLYEARNKLRLTIMSQEE